MSSRTMISRASLPSSLFSALIASLSFDLSPIPTPPPPARPGSAQRGEARGRLHGALQMLRPAGIVGCRLHRQQALGQLGRKVGETDENDRERQIEGGVE